MIKLAPYLLLTLVFAASTLAGVVRRNAGSNDGTCVPTSNPSFPQTTFGILPFDVEDHVEAPQQPNDTCHEFRQRTITVDSPANLQGSCPWAYRTHIDSDRIPIRMEKAYCICEGCLHHRGTGPGTCQVVNTNLNVLMKSAEPCVDGLYKYELRTIEWPVACRCMDPTIAG